MDAITPGLDADRKSAGSLARSGGLAGLAGRWRRGLGRRVAGLGSPINRRRWQSFKANRRGYWSLWLFLGIFALSLLAEVIANDRPILVRYKGEFLSPILVDYPETRFGGEFAVTDYKDPFIIEAIGKEGWALWPPIRYSYASINKDFPRVKTRDGRCLGFPAPPTWMSGAKLCEAPPDQLERYQAIGNRNWLGTDDQGRDVVARVIYGLRLSIVFGLLLTVFSATIGVVAGAVQGYFGGIVDLAFQRVIEIWTSIPSLYVLLIISAVFVPSFWTLLFILLVFHWTHLVSVVRAEFLRGRNFEYIKAARALGLSDTKIMFKHLLPNAMVATLTFLPFKLSSAIGALTALDFLGLGLPPGSPSLGELLLQGKSNTHAPWLTLTAFFSVGLILSLLIFVGEAVRDALDPRKTFR